MSSGKDFSYRIQNGCWNCRFVFVEPTYDDGDRLYCAYGAPERPPCGRDELDEAFPGRFGMRAPPEERAAWKAACYAWDKWKKGRSVQRECLCACWLGIVEEEKGVKVGPSDSDSKGGLGIEGEEVR